MLYTAIVVVVLFSLVYCENTKSDGIRVKKQAFQEQVSAAMVLCRYTAKATSYSLNFFLGI